MSQREGESEMGGAEKRNTRKRDVPTDLPGQGEFEGQGRVTQHSELQDFQRMTAPFSGEKKKKPFTGN